jgi:hypothetical protein
MANPESHPSSRFTAKPLAASAATVGEGSEPGSGQDRVGSRYTRAHCRDTDLTDLRVESPSSGLLVSALSEKNVGSVSAPDVTGC